MAIWLQAEKLRALFSASFYVSRRLCAGCAQQRNVGGNRARTRARVCVAIAAIARVRSHFLARPMSACSRLKN